MSNAAAIDLTSVGDDDSSESTITSYEMRDKYSRPCHILKRSKKNKGKVFVQYEDGSQDWIYQYYDPAHVFRLKNQHRTKYGAKIRNSNRYRIVGIGDVEDETADTPAPTDTFDVQQIDEADRPVGHPHPRAIISLRLETRAEKYAAERELKRKQDVAYAESARKDAAASSSAAGSPAFRVGDRVITHAGTRSESYGIILGVNPDGTFRVTPNNWSKKTTFRASELQLRSSTSNSSSSSSSSAAVSSSYRLSKEELRNLRLRALRKRKRAIRNEEERGGGRKKIKKRREYNRLLRHLL